MGPEPADAAILRAKYLDWCSAKLADEFLRLTPEEIYELAHASDPGPGSERAAAATVPAAPGPGALPPGLSYRELVARVTEALAARLGLPGFAAWVAAYRAAPDRYEEEMLGLWKEER